VRLKAALPTCDERWVKKILLIDDSPIVREHLRNTLAAAGYAVLESGDGVDGLQKLKGDAQISIVLCDVNMPRMNGLDLLEAWGRENTGPRIPFVMLTSEAQPALLARAKKAGAVGWMVKPYRPSLVEATVRRLLGD
jgi:two-component system chemotaxis response regulator CheY